MSSSRDNMRISSKVYDVRYLLQSMDGAKEFNLYRGEKISRRMEYALDIAKIQPDNKVLDIGCGRGELTYQCAKRKASAHGLDYSLAAICIAQELKTRANTLGLSMNLELASALHLPYKIDTFDIVFMLDIVEHLYPDELINALKETMRILKSGGKLIIHTMPNADYYRWVYPLYRVAMKAFGRNLPADPRIRWYRGDTHVNIQNPNRLLNTLVQAGFNKNKVWLQQLWTNNYLQMLLSLTPVRRLVINDIFGIAIKE